MRQVTVNGERYDARPLSAGRISPGSLVCHARSRKAYRALCYDGDELILRNARFANRIEAVGVREMESGWLLLSRRGV